MAYKFEKLEVWQLSLEYSDQIYAIADELPPSELYNLRSQILRASTSISLNISEGSTSQTNPEQARFLGLSIRSLIETVACMHLINRRNYLKDKKKLNEAYEFSQLLFAKLQSFRNTLLSNKNQVHDEEAEYITTNPF